MGVPIDDRISRSDQTSILEALVSMSLSKPQIQQFVDLARITP